MEILHQYIPNNYHYTFPNHVMIQLYLFYHKQNNLIYHLNVLLLLFILIKIFILYVDIYLIMHLKIHNLVLYSFNITNYHFYILLYPTFLIYHLNMLLLHYFHLLINIKPIYI